MGGGRRRPATDDEQRDDEAPRPDAQQQKEDEQEEGEERGAKEEEQRPETFWGRWAKPQDGGVPEAVVRWLHDVHGFTVVEFIARGGFGSVLRCRWQRPEGGGGGQRDAGEVAVKVLSWLDREKDELAAELWTFRRLDDALTDGNPQFARARDFVMRVLWSGKTELRDQRARRTAGAIALELADGSLADVERGTLGCDGALDLLADVLVGMRAMHHAGVVVCDIKPRNVLVFRDADGTGLRARLSDLGLCRPLGAAGFCGGSVWWTTVRHVDGWRKHQRPPSQGHDLFVFAKMCVWLLVRMEHASRAVTLAGPGWAERFAETGTVPAAKRARHQTAASASAFGPGATCLASERHAVALLSWATRTIDLANQRYAPLDRTQFQRAEVLEAPRPGHWFDLACVPPGLRARFAARVGLPPPPAADDADTSTTASPAVVAQSELFR